MNSATTPAPTCSLPTILVTTVPVSEWDAFGCARLAAPVRSMCEPLFGNFGGLESVRDLTPCTVGS